MTINAYDIGDMVEMQGNFTDINGNPLDPSAITLLVRTPDGVVQTFTYATAQLTKVSTGIYTYDFTVTMEGVHRYRFIGTGACQAAAEVSFSVRQSNIITG